MTAMEERWIPCNVRRFQAPKATLYGVQSFVGPSPYDVPEAISVATDQTRNLLVISFRYLEPEKTEAVPIRKGVVFHVGHRTRRIYAIEISATNVKKREALEKAVGEAVEAVSRYTPDRIQRRENFKAAKQAVENNADQLVRFAVAAV